MAVKSKWRGHTILETDGVWTYESDGLPVSEDPDRSCGYCKMPNTPEGHDGCLGTLLGVVNACCGHGDDASAYIQYSDGACAEGTEALRQACVLMKPYRDEPHRRTLAEAPSTPWWCWYRRLRLRRKRWKLTKRRWDKYPWREPLDWE